MNSKAFTLAEVLVTLGIIGVVAALTMPSLIYNTKKQETSARLKNFYSMMSQALILSENDNGMIEDWGKQSMIYDKDGNYDAAANSDISDTFFKKYIAPYFKYTSAEKDKTYNNYTNVRLANGSTFYVRNGGCYDIYYDINGEKNPNEIGRDKFIFVICTSMGNRGSSMTGSPFSAYCPKSSCNSRQKAINMCKQRREYCAGILQYDNWEIKDDYPVRL